MRTKIILSLLVFGAMVGVSFIVTIAASSQTPPPGLGTLSASERAARYQPGPIWDGKGTGNVDEASLSALPDFPLLWPGTSVSGYNLQAIIRSRYDAPAGDVNAHSQNSLTFIYGRCTPAPGQTGCMAPIGIHVQPACLVTPSMVANEVKAQNAETARGSALQQRFKDGHSQLWTGRVSVTIHASADYSRVNEVINQLKGIGAGGSGFSTTPASALPAPDFAGCKP